MLKRCKFTMRSDNPLADGTDTEKKRVKYAMPTPPANTDNQPEVK